MNIGGRIMWSHLKMRGVTVSVQKAPRPYVYLYRVVNVMDLGKRGRTAVIEPFGADDGFGIELMDAPRGGKKVVPARIGSLAFLNASKKQPRLSDVNYVASCVFGNDVSLERVVADVIAPGDILSVRPKRVGEGIHSIETLRVVKSKQKLRNGILHAV